MTALVILVSISALATAIVIHECTHFAVGLVMGTVQSAGITIRTGRSHLNGVPVGLFVSHTHRNWYSTLAPLVWLIPYGVVMSTGGSIPGLPLLYLSISFGVAGLAVFASDIPTALGYIDYGDESRYRTINLVDYRNS